VDPSNAKQDFYAPGDILLPLGCVGGTKEQPKDIYFVMTVMASAAVLRIDMYVLTEPSAAVLHIGMYVLTTPSAAVLRIDMYVLITPSAAVLRIDMYCTY
jgi:hypothetical protein